MEGRLESEPNKRYRLELFSNTACDPSGHGEGETYLGTGTCTAEFRLFDSSGAQVGSEYSMDVPVGRWQQKSDIFGAAGAGDQAIAYATVGLGGDGCLAWAYASVVDNDSGDPTTIPLLVGDTASR